MGPSVAHTSNITESTISIILSTSPPKSQCPGVSTILILLPSYVIDVHLDLFNFNIRISIYFIINNKIKYYKIVIPFSFSNSFPSIDLSWFNTQPQCYNKVSTNVVFP